MSGASSPPGLPKPKTLLPRPWYRFWPEAAILVLLALAVWGVMAARRRGETVVAIRDIAKGTEICAKDLGTAPLPHIEGIITDACEVEGGVAQEPIPAGSPFFMRAVARPQAFASMTIRSGTLVTSDSVSFKSTPFIEGAVTSPASLRRLAEEEIPAGSAVRESMLRAVDKDADIVGAVKRDLTPGQTIVAGDVVWVNAKKPPCNAPVATAALFAGDQVRTADAVCVAPGHVVAAYRVFAGALRPRRGAAVLLLPVSKEVAKAEAQLLSIAPAGEGATAIVALPAAEAERLAPVSDKPLQLLAKSGG